MVKKILLFFLVAPLVFADHLMYSILQHGLINNLNERAAFGEGTYLSVKIDVALGFAHSQRVCIPVRY